MVLPLANCCVTTVREGCLLINLTWWIWVYLVCVSWNNKINLTFPVCVCVLKGKCNFIDNLNNSTNYKSKARLLCSWFS